MPGFFDAATYPARGLLFLLGHRRLWPPAAAAFAVNLLIFTAGLAAFVVYLPDLAAAATPERFPACWPPSSSSRSSGISSRDPSSTSSRSGRCASWARRRSLRLPSRA